MSSSTEVVRWIRCPVCRARGAPFTAPPCWLLCTKGHITAALYGRWLYVGAPLEEPKDD